MTDYLRKRWLQVLTDVVIALPASTDPWKHEGLSPALGNLQFRTVPGAGENNNVLPVMWW